MTKANEKISRSEAREKGLTRYYTGKPCKYGHYSERLVSNATCLACVHIRSRKYRKNNPEKVSKSYKAYYQKNKDNLVEYKKGWYQENKSRINEHVKYRRKTDTSFRIAQIVRGSLERTLRATKGGKYAGTFELLEYTVDEFKTSVESKFLDGMCWENHGDAWHVDHIIPISRYITDYGVTDPSVINELGNLTPMWSEDNLSKNSKTLREFLEHNPEKAKFYAKFLYFS